MSPPAPASSVYNDCEKLSDATGVATAASQDQTLRVTDTTGSLILTIALIPPYFIRPRLPQFLRYAVASRSLALSHISYRQLQLQKDIRSCVSVSRSGPASRCVGSCARGERADASRAMKRDERVRAGRSCHLSRNQPHYWLRTRPRTVPGSQKRAPVQAYIIQWASWCSWRCLGQLKVLVSVPRPLKVPQVRPGRPGPPRSHLGPPGPVAPVAAFRKLGTDRQAGHEATRPRGHEVGARKKIQLGPAVELHVRSRKQRSTACKRTRSGARPRSRV